MLWVLLIAFAVFVAFRTRYFLSIGPITSARVIADSTNPAGSRLTTMLLTYPRMVHVEFLTHRAFARNASSSRARPSRLMRREIHERMALPVEWGTNKPGMQAGSTSSRAVRALGAFVWVALGYCAIAASFLLDLLGLHKQIVNRVTESWSHIDVVVSSESAGWANFYALRAHKLADPTLQALAFAALEVHRQSTPKALALGQWHLPFVTDYEVSQLRTDALLAASVARAARTSYKNHDGTAPNIAKDLALYTRLVGDTPKHASPTEHQAEAIPVEICGQGGCFGDTGWRQHRKQIAGESVTDLAAILNPDKTT